MSSKPTVQESTSNGQSSRRDNHTASTSSSQSGKSERDKGSRPSNPAVESAVTRLLVSIKQLLEALTFWSQLKMDEYQVSDVYVRLGNDFNAAVAAFAAFSIDMSELLSVPDELRNVLEQCLSEDATPENLEMYLPSVRQIITNLLQGLRGKQSIYRRIVSDHRHKSGEGHERTDSRSSRGERSSRRDPSHRSQLSRTVTEEEIPESSTISRRSGQSSSKRRNPESLSASSINGNEQSTSSGSQEISVPQASNADPSINTSESQHRRQRSAQPTSERALPSPPPPPPSEPSQPSLSTFPEEVQAEAAPNPGPVPSSVKRYSLVDKPTPAPPEVVVEPSSPDATEQPRESSDTPPPDPTINPPPAVASSLAALKKSDVLERRASKRFSTYNISKMTGGSTSRERSLRGHPNRRSLAAASSALTPGELAVLTEVEDEEPAPSVRRDGSVKSRLTASRPTTPQRGTPTVPPMPVTPSRTPEPTPAIELPHQELSTSEAPSTSSRMTVFLQVGREVKKVVVDPGISFSSLRVLFVDRFAYNPGQENFPAIYIRDPSSGVQYELEDTDEVKDKCLLSLNIEPLDQIKQHIDAQMSTLSQEIKDLRTTMASNHRHSSHISDMPMAESTPAPNRPSDRQFQHVARRLSRFVGDSQSSFFTPPSPVVGNGTQSLVQPQMTGQFLQAQMTGGSMLSDYTSRVVGDLKTQFDEVQNLRRDLGVMRQMYTEFMKQTKESLGTLRTQTQSVKQLANSNVGGARAYIDSGKKKLDTRSQNVLTDVEKLQDTVESVKDDVIKRHVTPKVQYFKNIKNDIDAVATELESLKEHIKTIKPMWKKTWEEELQNIVEEQQFLTHQEEFLSDLLEDHKSVVEIYGHVEKVISLRGTSSNGSVRAPRNRNFRPPPPEEGHNGLSTVMLELRGAVLDPGKRLEAIEASARNREKEKAAAQSDEMQAELTEFIGQKKLKMTGGAEEAERVRQRRNEQTLKAMFTGRSPPPSDFSELNSTSSG